MQPAPDEVIPMLFKEAVELWGNRGYFIVQKNDLVYMEPTPGDVSKALTKAVFEYAKTLGYDYEFMVESIFHREYGDCFRINWRPAAITISPI